MIKQNDFIEIDFSGRVKGGEVFDSTKKEDLEKLHKGHNHPIEAEPLVFCIGKGMFLEALDNFLEGKKVGEKYEVELSPEDAFGKRDPSKVQRIPSKVFMEQRVNPVPGAVFNFDGRAGKVLTASGGRVVVDFNHALAGKDVVYKIKVLKKINDINEKVRAVNKFFLKRNFDFEVDEKNKKILMDSGKDSSFKRIIELFKDKYKDILGMDVEVKEKKSEESKSKAEKKSNKESDGEKNKEDNGKKKAVNSDKSNDSD